MLAENLKTLRATQKLTQEELDSFGSGGGL